MEAIKYMRYKYEIKRPVSKSYFINEITVPLSTFKDISIESYTSLYMSLPGLEASLEVIL